MVQVVNRLGQQILNAVATAAQAHVGDVEAVGIGRLQRVQDVLGAGACDRAGEHVVVAKQGPRRDARYAVRDGDAVDAGSGLVVAGHRAGHMGAVLADGLGAETVLRQLVVEDPGRDDLVVGETRVTELALRQVTAVGEAGMRLVDAGIHNRHLDAGTGRGRCSAIAGPRLLGIDQREVGIDDVGIKQTLVLRRRHHRGGRHLGQRSAAQLDGDRVERDVELAGHAGARHGRAQPGLVVVAQPGQLRPVSARRVARKVDLLALGRLGAHIGRQRLAAELYQRVAAVLRRARRDAIGGWARARHAGCERAGQEDSADGGRRAAGRAGQVNPGHGESFLLWGTALAPAQQLVAVAWTKVLTGVLTGGNPC